MSTPRIATPEDRFFVIDFDHPLEDLESLLTEKDLGPPRVRGIRKIQIGLYLFAVSSQSSMIRLIELFTEMGSPPRMPSYYELPHDVTGEVDFAPVDVYSTEYELKRNMKGPTAIYACKLPNPKMKRVRIVFPSTAHLLRACQNGVSWHSSPRRFDVHPIVGRPKVVCNKCKSLSCQQSGLCSLRCGYCSSPHRNAACPVKDEEAKHACTICEQTEHGVYKCPFYKERRNQVVKTMREDAIQELQRAEVVVIDAPDLREDLANQVLKQHMVASSNAYKEEFLRTAIARDIVPEEKHEALIQLANEVHEAHASFVLSQDAQSVNFLAAYRDTLKVKYGVRQRAPLDQLTYDKERPHPANKRRSFNYFTSHFVIDEDHVKTSDEHKVDVNISDRLIEQPHGDASQPEDIDAFLDALADDDDLVMMENNLPDSASEPRYSLPNGTPKVFIDSQTPNDGPGLSRGDHPDDLPFDGSLFLEKSSWTLWQYLVSFVLERTVVRLMQVAAKLVVHYLRGAVADDCYPQCEWHGPSCPTPDEYLQWTESRRHCSQASGKILYGIQTENGHLALCPESSSANHMLDQSGRAFSPSHLEEPSSRQRASEGTHFASYYPETLAFLGDFRIGQTQFQNPHLDEVFRPDALSALPTTMPASAAH